MLLHLIHETRYGYTPSVETAQHMAHLKPLNTAEQQLLAHQLHIHPEPAQRSESQDLWGNTRTFFALQATHEKLQVRAESLVRTTAPPPAPYNAHNLSWETLRERFTYCKDMRDDAASEFLFPSLYAPPLPDFAAYARPSFGPGRPLLEAVTDLNQRIFEDFEFDNDSTTVNTPAVQALALRRGVCQDFAHIMIACCRAMGLPARYVSGYLLTQPPPGQPRLIGADASHAWMELFVPSNDGGPGTWMGQDPTNGRAPGEDYVTLAIGRDYADVTPLRGVLHGGTKHAMQVEVTVQPHDEGAPLPSTAPQSPAQMQSQMPFQPQFQPPFQMY